MGKHRPRENFVQLLLEAINEGLSSLGKKREKRRRYTSKRKHSRALLMVAVFMFIAMLVSTQVARAEDGAKAKIWTDKADYHPGEVVSIFGLGFLPNTNIAIYVTKQADGTNSSFNTISDLNGNFSTTYQIDNVGAPLFSVMATDGTNTATTTFTDATLALDGSGSAANNGNSQYLNLPGWTTTKPNDLIYLAVVTSVTSGLATVTSVQQPAGLTAWASRSNVTFSTYYRIQTFYAVQSSAGAIATISNGITLSKNCRGVTIVFAISGAQTSSPFDVATPSTATGTTITPSTTITTTTANDFIIGVLGTNGNPAVTANSTMSIILTQAEGSQVEASAEYKVVSSTLTGSRVGFTLGTSQPWGIIADAVKTDTVAPSVVIGSPSAGFVNVAVVPVSGTASDSGSGVASVQWQVDSTSGSWTAASGSVSWSFTTGVLSEGAHTIYVRATDGAGNTATISVTVTVDTVAPASSVNALSTFELSTSFAVSYSASDATSGVASVHLWVKVPSGVYVDVGVWTSGAMYSAVAGDGLYEFYTRATDNAGNLEAAPGSADASTTVHTSNPSGSIVINSGATYSASTGVTLTLSATDADGDAIVSMCFSVDGTAWGSWEAYGVSKAWTLTGLDGVKSVYVKFLDDAGAESPVYSDGIILDTVAPASSVNALSTFELSTSFAVSYSASDATSGVASVHLWVKVPSGVYVDVGVWTSGAMYSAVAGDGLYEFYTRATDNAGNLEAAPGSADASTTVHTSNPSGSIVINSGATYSASTGVTLTLSATDADGDAIVSMCFSVDGTAWGSWEAYGVSKAWTLTGLDGVKSVYVKFLDDAGAESPVYSDGIILDTVAPASSVNALSTFELSTSFAVSYSASDATSGVASVHLWVKVPSGVYVDVGVWTSGAMYSAVAGDGLYEFYTRATDNAGNLEAAPGSADASTTVHTSNPSGSIVINSGATYSASTGVTLTLSATDADGDAIVSMCFSVDGTAWGSWEAYGVSKAWTLTGLDGVKSVYVKFLDDAGAESPVYSDGIILDTVAPASSVNALSTFELSTSFAVSYSASDATSGVASVHLWVKVPSGVYVDVGVWTSGAMYSAVAGDGLYEFYTRATDNAGNLEAAPGSADASTTVHTSNPSGSIVINSGATYSASTGVTLTLSATDADGDAIVSMCFSVDGTAWGSWEAYGVSKAWTLTGLDGVKSVYVKFLDDAGAESPVYSDGIILDTVAPASSVNALSTFELSTSFAVSYSASDATSGVASVHLWVKVPSGVYVDVGVWTSGAMYSAVAGDGLYEFYTRATDNAGNLEAAPGSADASTTVHTSNPSGSIVINSGATYSASTGVTLTLSATDADGDAIVSMCFSVDGTAWGSWEAYGVSKAWTLTGLDGVKSVYVKFLDDAGAESPVYSDGIILDTVAPASSVNALSTFELSTSFAVSYSASDATSGVASVHLWVKVPSGVYVDVGVWTSGAMYSAVAGDGLYEFYTRATDNAGNLEAAPGSADASTTVHTSNPSGSIVINSGATYSASTGVTLTLSATDADGDAIVSMCFSVDGTAWGSWEAYGVSKAWTLTGLDGVKSVYVKFLDDAGAESPVYSDGIILDTVAPASSVNALSTFELSTSFAVSYSASDATSGVASVHLWVKVPSGVYVDVGVWTSGAMYSAVAGDGLYEFYTRATDNAGNLEAAPGSADASTTVHTSNPSGSIVINSGATYSASTGVTLTLSATDADGDAIVSMCFSVDGTAWGSWEAYGVSKAWTLTGLDGVKSVYVKFLDDAGAESPVYSDGIILDTVAPVVVIGSPSAGFVNVAVVPVSGTASDSGSGVVSVQWQVDSTSGSWTAASGTYSWFFATGVLSEGVHTIYVVATDGAGNIASPVSVTVTVATLDHFVFDTVGSQIAGTSFSLTVTAMDAFGNTVTSYSGTPSLAYSAGSINPIITGAFSGGVWSGLVTVTVTGLDVTVTATDGSHSGVSNSFTVNHDIVVGGEIVPVNILQVLAPYLLVAVLGVGAIVSLVLYRKKKS